MLGDLLKSIPERHRWKVYVGLLAVSILVLVVLLVIDVWRGGDAGSWVKWLAGLVGLGGGAVAVANTDRRG